MRGGVDDLDVSRGDGVTGTVCTSEGPLAPFKHLYAVATVTNRGGLFRRKRSRNECVQFVMLWPEGDVRTGWFT